MRMEGLELISNSPSSHSSVERLKYSPQTKTADGGGDAYLNTGGTHWEDHLDIPVIL
jgi:hypothetical protein